MSDITWYGHSAFKIGASDIHLLVDPFFTPASGVDAKTVGPVDVVLVTHDHADHVGEAVAVCRTHGAMLGAVVGTAGKLAQNGVPEDRILNGIGFNIGGTVEHQGVRITMTQAYHSSDSGVPVGYILRMPDGLTVYHAGDTGVFSGMELWGQLYSIDVALLPIGGVFTMDAGQAALACRLLRCKAVVPMHWGTFPVLAGDTKEFARALEAMATDCRLITMDIRQRIEFTA
ncbi:MAG: metal-dependent hydrolase [Desulfovibrio sp.]|jgi:L-ascorbate metabolism protein UlaG (beta-lactamase superfamily)|nr:metal-dependent hydrolase [Desulfovibrio sp.]